MRKRSTVEKIATVAAAVAVRNVVRKNVRSRRRRKRSLFSRMLGR